MNKGCEKVKDFFLMIYKKESPSSNRDIYEVDFVYRPKTRILRLSFV